MKHTRHIAVLYHRVNHACGLYIGVRLFKLALLEIRYSLNAECVQTGKASAI